MVPLIECNGPFVPVSALKHLRQFWYDVTDVCFWCPCRWVRHGSIQLGFALQLSDLPQGSLHHEIMCRMSLPGPLLPIWLPRLTSMSGYWACQRPLIMMVQFPIDKSSVCRKAAGTFYEVWQGLHASPRSAPSTGARLCTYHCRSARIGPVPEPYFQMLSCRCMRCLFCSRLGAHAYKVSSCPLKWARGCAWHGLRTSALSGQACMWDKRHLAVECATFDDIRHGSASFL